MSDTILLVQGDTRPQVVVTITDLNTANVVNVAGASVVMKFRPSGGAVKVVIPLTLAPGLDTGGGVINAASPYDIPGAGGRAYFDWPEDALDTPGKYQGEVEVTFADGRIQTAFELLQFRIRAQF